MTDAPRWLFRLSDHLKTTDGWEEVGQELAEGVIKDAGPDTLDLLRPPSHVPGELELARYVYLGMVLVTLCEDPPGYVVYATARVMPKAA
jgi:hypothetical protein